MEPKFELKVAEGTSTLVIREDSALDVRPLSTKVELKGSIKAPQDYIRKKYATPLLAIAAVIAATDAQAVTYKSGDTAKDYPQLQKGVISFSKQPGKQRIEFDEYPDNDWEGAKVIGHLTLNPDLVPWQINKNKFFTAAAMVELIRTNAHVMDEAQAKKLIELLRNFEVEFAEVARKADDRKGNTDLEVKQSITFKKGEIPKNLAIVLPLFKGTDKKTVSLELELERRQGEVQYAFYSLQLEAMLRNEADTIIDGILTDFSDLFVVVEELD